MFISYNPLTPLSHSPHTDTVRQRLKTQVEFNNKYQKFNATAPTHTVQLSKIQKLNKKNQNIHTVIHSHRLSEITYQTHSHSERKRELKNQIKRWQKADQAAAAAADFVCEVEAVFFLWVWRVKKNNERFWKLGSKKFLGFILPFF